MQDDDFKQIYEPGKAAADPSEFLSRHPLSEKGKNAIERVIKYVVIAKLNMSLDTRLQKRSIRILTGDWEQHRKVSDIA